MRKSNINKDCEFLVGYLNNAKEITLQCIKHLIQAHPTKIITFKMMVCPDIYDNCHRYQLRSMYVENDSIIICFDESLHGKMVEIADHRRLDEMGIDFLQELLKRLSDINNIF